MALSGAPAGDPSQFTVTLAGLITEHTLHGLDPELLHVVL